MNPNTHTHTYTHKENPLMDEMREGPGSVTEWIKDEGRRQRMSMQGSEPNSSTFLLISWAFYHHMLISSASPPLR